MSDSQIPKEVFNDLEKSMRTQMDEYEKTQFRRLQLVTPTLFAKFLAEKGVSGNCLACGSTELSTPETMSLDSSRYLFKDKKRSELTPDERALNAHAAAVHYVTPSIIDPNKAPLISNYQFRMICQNCGFISYFRAASVVFWVEELMEINKDPS